MTADLVCIVGADQLGLGMTNGSDYWFEPWDAVTQIIVARIPWAGNVTSLAAVFTLSMNRHVVIYECQPEWSEVLSAAHNALHLCAHSDSWKLALGEANEGLIIYEHGPMPDSFH